MQKSPPTQTNPKKFKVIFLGKQGVGKTCLITKHIYNKFDHNSTATIGVDFMVKDYHHNNKRYKIHFWDTAGQERFQSLIPSYVKDCDAAIIVYDSTNRDSFTQLDVWANKLIEGNLKSGIIGILGNKFDVSMKDVAEEEGKEKADKLGADFTECSAKTGQNLDLFFDAFLNKMISKFENEEKEKEKGLLQGNGYIENHDLEKTQMEKTNASYCCK